uniref:arginine--tRNA ligase n=1 Tax=Dermatophagoides pteronyssinus TaxID=6956 RepID=A0A6P6Y5U3_DERPT|nr:uncharacterized protein LOC113794450 [Dermatophagoides pteronyssinus]
MRSDSLLFAVKRAFQHALDQLLQPHNAAAEAQVVRANPKFGDYQCNSALTLMRSALPQQLGVNCAAQLAEKIVASLDSELFSEVVANKQGFITVRISSAQLAAFVKRLLLDSPAVAVQRAEPLTVCVDFSSPNIAKEMHVGHLRSTVHGAALSNLLEFLGHKVRRINHVGDWGTQFGMIIEHLVRFEPEFFSSTYSLSQLNAIYKASKARFDSDEQFKQSARKRVVLLQSGDADSLAYWRKLVDLSTSAFESIYERLDVHLELCGESFYNSQLSSVADECARKGFLSEADGAMVFFLEAEGKINLNEVPLFVTKADGGYGYDSTDLAAIRHRLCTERFDWVIYVTDLGQRNHFLGIFQAARKLGWLQPTKHRADHVGLGLVCGADGKKFRTRSGETVRLVDLLDEAERRAFEECVLRAQQRGETEQRDEAELHAVAKTLGIAALKYFDMNQVCSSNYSFDYDKMLERKGNTAVYILYTYARMVSVMRTVDAAADPQTHCAPAAALAHASEPERKLLLHLARFEEALDETTQTLSMHKLCDFAYSLCVLFSEFYENCRSSVSTAANETQIIPSVSLGDDPS